MRIFKAILICLILLFSFEIATAIKFQSSAIVFYVTFFLTIGFEFHKIIKSYNFQALFNLSLLSLISYWVFNLFAPSSYEPRAWHSYVSIKSGELSESDNGMLLFENEENYIFQKKEEWYSHINSLKSGKRDFRVKWYIFIETAIDENNKNEFIANLDIVEKKETSYLLKGLLVFIELALNTILKYLLFIIIWYSIFQYYRKKNSSRNFFENEHSNTSKKVQL